MKPVLFSEDQQFWFETLRALGHTAYGGADVNEVLGTAQRIKAGDYESWYREWRALAERVEREGRASKRPITRRDAFLRANNYWRTAEFFLHGLTEDPRADEAYERAVTCFRDAVALMPGVTRVEIPFEGTVLHGYFYRAPGEGPKPTLVVHSGFDGSCEEMHCIGAAAGVERGYHVLTFDGPGQPAARHRDGLVFRPDWENVVRPVLDWVLKQPGVGPVGLVGVSMGGLLAPRAAAFEPRLSACVALDGVYDLGIVSTARFPMPRHAAEVMLRAPSAPELDRALEESMATNPTARWAVHHGMWVMGVKSPRAFLASYLDYSLANGVAEKIRCPTLVCEAEQDIFFEGQPKMLFDHLTCEKTFMRFTDADDAGAHCHPGAQRFALGRIFDWLDATLARATS
jgi:pimeloyl-ACP methyl ester carboxylesterase